jgi:glycine/D-amino acid oxidase-like deaminating enzyme
MWMILAAVAAALAAVAAIIAAVQSRRAASLLEQKEVDKDIHELDVRVSVLETKMGCEED